MTRKELCEMCTEYSTDTKCENEEHCTMLKILNRANKLEKENKQLKADNKQLLKENKERRIRESWEKSPDMMGK